MSLGTQAARYLSSSPMRGAALGAGVGAASQMVRTPVEGDTRRGAMLRGAIRGAAVGGATAAAGRAYRDTRLLNPSLSAAAAVPAAVSRAGAGLRDFAKRQVHGVTGHFDPDSIGMAGTATAKKRVDLLNRRVLDDVKHSPGKREALLAAHASEVKGVTSQGAQGQALRDAGVTSIKGIAGALRDPARRGAAIRAMGSTLTSGAGPGGAALALGVPVAMQAPSLLRGDESQQGGYSVGQKIRGLGAGIATGAMVGGLPILPQMIGGGLLDAAAQRVVKGRKETR